MAVNTSIQRVASTVAAINADLPGLVVSLQKGEGYFYFVADVERPGIDVFETHSVYANSFGQLPFEQWVVEGHDFIRKVKGIVADQIERNAIPLGHPIRVEPMLDRA